MLSKYLTQKGIPYKEVFYKAGSKIFSEGDPGDILYFIESGQVQITRNLEGREITLAILKPDEYFGEMALITGRKRNASAFTLDDCTLYAVDQKGLYQIISTDTDFALVMMRTLAERLDQTAEAAKKSMIRLENVKEYAEIHRHESKALNELLEKLETFPECYMP
ncbi:MAG TPA: Crp/Fnr family transcriptional regulator [Candidatus Hypogeohydataceae bacterium YC38]|jgi:CRP-like cAMP-binding protein